MSSYLAVDIGASSGRHMLGSVKNGRFVTEEVYRFPNTAITKNGHLCWNIDELWAHIIAGMRECAKYEIPVNMGIDTWAVDFVLLDDEGNMIGDAVTYRDPRTEGMTAEVEKIIQFEELYNITGIQKLPINTIYQLMSLKLAQPQMLEKAERLLMIPDYFGYLLTGNPVQEYTNATTTALVNAEKKDWDWGLINRLGYPEKVFSPIVETGSVLGELLPQIQREVGYNCRVRNVAGHDTASAFLAVPARDENAVYISSGTWSLLGTENHVPVITERAMNENFTNEGGYRYNYRILRNIMGLWMLQSMLRETDGKYTFAQLEQMAEKSDYPGVVDVSDTKFLAPKSMIEAVDRTCEESGFPPPKNLADTVCCIYNSLANSYAESVKALEAVMNRRFTSINIVGGGSKDNFLNLLTARAAGLPVYSGPSEATVIGNCMVQMIEAGEFSSLADARKSVAESFQVASYQ